MVEEIQSNEALPLEEVLLRQLDEERSKFTKANDDLMESLIAQLQELGEYPMETREGNPNTVSAMVDGYGARWHKWKGTLNCPHCDADFRDLKGGPPFMRQIGISNGDSVYAWRCPDCNHEWPRG